MKRSSTLLSAVVAIALPFCLAACGGGGGSRGISFVNDDGSAVQPFPQNYRAELLAFFHSYINNPVGVRDAALADPVERNIGGRLRYVSCVRYSARDMSGKYLAPEEHGVSFIDGRLDSIVENTSDACGGAAYKPFPDMEKMAR